LPVYDLITGHFTGEVCGKYDNFTVSNVVSVFIDLEPKFFNNPLRRDLVAKVFHYFTVLGQVKTHVAKTKGDVAGSGKKPAPQKGRGKARVGNKRAPQRAGGGAAHGPVPRDLTQKINGKLRVKALQIMLSAKLYEDRLVIVDSESMDFGKTKLLHEIIKPYKTDRLTFLTPFDASENFLHAASNLANVTVRNPQ
jgi:large subunit ribosomal protein L4